VSERSSTRTATAWLLLVGGGLVIVGSLLPWMTARTVFGTLQRGALDGDGLITLGAGAVLAACGVAGLLKAPQTPILIVGLLAGLTGGSVLAYDGTRIVRLLDDINSDSSGVAQAELGAGLVVLALGVLCSLVGLAMSAWLVGHRRRAGNRHGVPAALLPVLAVALMSLAIVGSGAVAAGEPLDRDAPEVANAEGASPSPMTSADESPSAEPTASATPAEQETPVSAPATKTRSEASGSGVPDCGGPCTVDHRLMLSDTFADHVRVERRH
jgi:hypothetical protein